MDGVMMHGWIKGTPNYTIIVALQCATSVKNYKNWKWLILFDSVSLSSSGSGRVS